MMKKNEFFIIIILAVLLCSVITLFYGLSKKALIFTQQETAPAYTQAIADFDIKDWES